MSKPQTATSTSVKRLAGDERGEEEEEEEDETPLYSRSPSPVLDRPNKHEAASLQDYLAPRNVGHAMLLKMGWVVGQGLGITGQGRVEPVPISEKRGSDLTGIGKMSLDLRTVDASVAQRREMASERMGRETEEERSRRLDEAARMATAKAGAAEAKSAFRCELCDKGYSIPSAYEAHLTSYDHHHRKRLREMLASEKARHGAGATDKRKAKESAREAKELARLMGASAPTGRATKPPNTTAAGGLGPQSALDSAGEASTSNPVRQETSTNASTSARPSQGGGWKKVGSASVLNVSGPAASAPNNPSSGVARPSHDPRDSHHTHATAYSRLSAPKFRSSGFETLETTSTRRDERTSSSTLAKLPAGFRPVDSFRPLSTPKQTAASFAPVLLLDRADRHVAPSLRTSGDSDQQPAEPASPPPPPPEDVYPPPCPVEDFPPPPPPQN
ncbi:hypothetical protein IE81DRAFT_363759 [Ceraceosorus guamensis]|uniref:G-patch domain-containing protein n=1 Tax=Ceraceosorus guamensis TaxID=1522189 RepID=A0A316WF60_9BASI|nr:hypothetical protein IE81DRAFT_363759 [Ceraceosorus guamensis]PWN45935.1 hypothetical protein IE81DRAFT_363759 [Ceraceosorus guamensis]